MPVIAFAGVEGVYYTYNGFDPVVSAFKRIALITSDPNYRSLYGIVLVLAVGSAGFYNLSKGLAGGGGHVINAWAFPFGIGLIVFYGMFTDMKLGGGSSVNKSTITVYDPVLNRQETVYGIPNAIAALAIASNSMERSFVDIVSTSGAPGDYSRQAGGAGFDLISKSTQIPPSNSKAAMSTVEYVKECVIFEVSRPGTTLTWEEVLRVQTTATAPLTLMDVLEKAKNPNIYLITYLGDAPAEGKTVNCDDAYEALKKYYVTDATTNMNNKLNALCGKSGYGGIGTSVDGTSTSEDSCQTAIYDIVKGMTGIEMPATSFAAMQEVSISFFTAMQAASPTTAASLITDKNMTEGVTAGFTVAQWIPIVKGHLTALVLAVMPILMVFLPSPLGPRAFQVIVGMFLLIATWGCTDILIHIGFMEYAVRYFRDIKESGVGLYTYLTFPDNATAVMSLYGYLRSMSLTLAAFILAQLVKIGGTQLGQLASNTMSSLHNSSMKGSDIATSPETKGSYMSSLLAGHSGLANASRFSASDLYAGAEFITLANTKGQLTSLRNHGGGVESASSRVGEAAGYSALSNTVGTEQDKRNYAQAVKDGALPPGTSLEQYLAAKNAKASFIDGTGAVLTQQTGTDGNSQTERKFTGNNGYTGTENLVNGKPVAANIGNSGSWGTTYAIDNNGNLVPTANNNRALGLTLDSAKTSTYQQAYGNSFAEMMQVGQKNHTGYTAGAKYGFGEKEAVSFANKWASNVAQELSKGNEYARQNQRAIETAFATALKADPAKLAAVLVGGVTGSMAVGLMEQVAGAHPELNFATTRRSNETGSSSEKIGTISKEAASKAIEAANDKRADYSEDYTKAMEAGRRYDKDHGNSYSRKLDETFSQQDSRGGHSKRDLETPFLNGLTNNAEFLNSIGADPQSSEYDRRAAVNNWAGSHQDELETMARAYLAEVIAADGDTQKVANAIAEGGGNVVSAYNAADKNIGAKVANGQEARGLTEDPGQMEADARRGFARAASEVKKDQRQVTNASKQVNANTNGANAWIKDAKEELQGVTKLYTDIPSPGNVDIGTNVPVGAPKNQFIDGFAGPTPSAQVDGPIGKLGAALANNPTFNNISNLLGEASGAAGNIASEAPKTVANVSAGLNNTSDALHDTFYGGRKDAYQNK